MVQPAPCYDSLPATNFHQVSLDMHREQAADMRFISGSAPCPLSTILSSPIIWQKHWHPGKIAVRKQSTAGSSVVSVGTWERAVSQDCRKSQFGRDLWRFLVQPSAQRKSRKSRLLQALFSRVFNISKDGDPTVFLGPYLTTHIVIFFSPLHWDSVSCVASRMCFLFHLLLCIFKKSLAVSPLHSLPLHS